MRCYFTLFLLSILSQASSITEVSFVLTERIFKDDDSTGSNLTQTDYDWLNTNTSWVNNQVWNVSFQIDLDNPLSDRFNDYSAFDGYTIHELTYNLHNNSFIMSNGIVTLNTVINNLNDVFSVTTLIVTDPSLFLQLGQPLSGQDQEPYQTDISIFTANDGYFYSEGGSNYNSVYPVSSGTISTSGHRELLNYRDYASNDTASYTLNTSISDINFSPVPEVSTFCTLLASFPLLLRRKRA